MKYNGFYMLFLFLSLFFASCATDWLDIKRDQKLVVPETLKDLQALLDNTSVFNYAKSPSIGEISSDDVMVMDQEWLSVSSVWQKNAYIWENDIFQGVITSGSTGWESPYRQVFYANVILEGLKKNSFLQGESTQWQEIRGSALFWRSWAFYQLVQTFCNQYHPESAAVELGIPLPLESDINIKYKRTSLEQSYKQILDDLELASSLLPVKTQFPTQPSKSAAYGLLARLYLQNGDFEKSYHYADLSFSLSSGLMDYNSIVAGQDYTFQQFNQEVILENSLEHYSSGILADFKMRVHPELFEKYDEGDLRKKLFYQSTPTGYRFIGSYSGTLFLFSGISANEVFLIKMESALRIGKYDEASGMFNSFLQKRIEDKFYTTKESVNLDDILNQRRLELPFRGLRWLDIKRLNAEGYGISIERTVQGKVFTLPSGSPRFVMPIPPNVIDINPDIIQNNRE